MQIKAETHNGKISLLGQNEGDDGEETASSRYLKMSSLHWQAKIGEELAQPLAEQYYNIFYLLVAF